MASPAAVPAPPSSDPPPKPDEAAFTAEAARLAEEIAGLQRVRDAAQSKLSTIRQSNDELSVSAYGPGSRVIVCARTA